MYFLNLVFFDDFNFRVLQIYSYWKLFILVHVFLLILRFFFDTEILFEGLL